MPLLVCPSCDGSMQAHARNGVEIDVCAKCRGVWLDRGELEKLLTLARSEEEGSDRPHVAPQQQNRPAPEYRRDDDDDDWKDRRYAEGDKYDPRYRKKKRWTEIFDIFD